MIIAMLFLAIGHKVLHQVTSMDGLPAGVYIINGRKVIKK